MCNIKKEEYVNRAHMFYCEFLKLAKSTFPNTNLLQYTVEDIIDKGMMTHNRVLFEKIDDICRFLDFSYTDDFVLIKYKPYYVLYPEWERYCEKNRLKGKTEKDVWDYWGGLLRFCRGIVFHRHSGALVINPYEKFFNIDELEECSSENVADKIKEATTVEVSEKLDGSLIMARFFNGKFVMCSSGQLDEHKCPQLRESYDLLVKNGLLRSMVKHYPQLTFIFELISPNDAHVVKYKGEPKLVLIGIKSTHAEYVFPYSKVTTIAADWLMPCANVYNMTLEDILNSRDDKKAFEAEGFVLNIDGYRVKVKYNDYLNVAGFVSSLNPKIVLKAVADGCIEELKLSCPGCTEYIDNIVNVIFDYVKSMTEQIDRYYKIASKICDNKREFMKYIQENVPRHLLNYVIQKYYGEFSMSNLLKSRSGKYTKYYDIKEYVDEEKKDIIPF